MSDAMPATDTDASTAECPYCQRTFARETYRDLHLGLSHEDQLTDAERAAYEEARAAEEETLTIFRYKVLGLLVVVYFLFLMLYAASL